MTKIRNIFSIAAITLSEEASPSILEGNMPKELWCIFIHLLATASSKVSVQRQPRPNSMNHHLTEI